MSSSTASSGHGRGGARHGELVRGVGGTEAPGAERRAVRRLGRPFQHPDLDGRVQAPGLGVVAPRVEAQVARPRGGVERPRARRLAGDVPRAQLGPWADRAVEADRDRHLGEALLGRALDGRDPLEARHLRGAPVVEAEDPGRFGDATVDPGGRGGGVEDLGALRHPRIGPHHVPTDGGIGQVQLAQVGGVVADELPLAEATAATPVLIVQDDEPRETGPHRRVEGEGLRHARGPELARHGEGVARAVERGPYFEVAYLVAHVAIRERVQHGAHEGHDGVAGEGYLDGLVGGAVRAGRWRRAAVEGGHHSAAIARRTRAQPRPRDVQATEKRFGQRPVGLRGHCRRLADGGQDERLAHAAQGIAQADAEVQPLVVAKVGGEAGRDRDRRGAARRHHDRRRGLHHARRVVEEGLDRERARPIGFVDHGDLALDALGVDREGLHGARRVVEGDPGARSPAGGRELIGVGILREGELEGVAATAANAKLVAGAGGPLEGEAAVGVRALAAGLGAQEVEDDPLVQVGDDLDGDRRGEGREPVVVAVAGLADVALDAQVRRERRGGRGVVVRFGVGGAPERIDRRQAKLVPAGRRRPAAHPHLVRAGQERPLDPGEGARSGRLGAEARLGEVEEDLGALGGGQLDPHWAVLGQVEAVDVDVAVRGDRSHPHDAVLEQHAARELVVRFGLDRARRGRRARGDGLLDGRRRRRRRERLGRRGLVGVGGRRLGRRTLRQHPQGVDARRAADAHVMGAGQQHQLVEPHPTAVGARRLQAAAARVVDLELGDALAHRLDPPGLRGTDDVEAEDVLVLRRERAADREVLAHGRGAHELVVRFDLEAVLERRARREREGVRAVAVLVDAQSVRTLGEHDAAQRARIAPSLLERRAVPVGQHHVHGRGRVDGQVPRPAGLVRADLDDVVVGVPAGRPQRSLEREHVRVVPAVVRFDLVAVGDRAGRHDVERHRPDAVEGEPVRPGGQAQARQREAPELVGRGAPEPGAGGVEQLEGERGAQRALGVQRPAPCGGVLVQGPGDLHAAVERGGVGERAGLVAQRGAAASAVEPVARRAGAPRTRRCRRSWRAPAGSARAPPGTARSRSGARPTCRTPGACRRR